MNKKTPIIKYTSRDFESLRNDIIEYGKRNYGESFKDQAFVGFGANLIDNVALIGDMLSFYLDYNVNESFLDTAIEFKNVIQNAKQMGYKFKNNFTSFGEQSFYIIVPAAPGGTYPNSDYRGILKKGTQLNSVNGDGFILNTDVNFNSSAAQIVVARVNEATGFPTHFAIKMKGQVISGRIVRETIEVGDYQRFLKLELKNRNIAEILSVIDSEGNEYYEVENLTQDIIFKGVINRDQNTNEYASRLLRPFVVPRRFIVEREFQTTFLQFGYGSENDLTIEPLIDPSSVVLEQYGKNYISDVSFDPTKLLKTNKLGVVPSNTTLQITYRTNQGQNSNVGINGLTEVVSPQFEFNDISSLNLEEVRNVISSLETNNEEPIVGDSEEITQEEIKHRAYGSFSAQKRCVTLQDYKSFIYQMPPEFGSVKRVNIVQDNDSFKRNLNIYVISQNQNGKLVETNSTIKENLKQWIQRGKMLNDTIDILDAKIVNYSLEYTVIGELNIDKLDIRNRCNFAIESKLQTLPDIGEPLFISEFKKILNRVENVVDVVDVIIRKKTGGVYSDATFNFDSQMSSDKRFIKVPKNVIMELRFPSTDIKGNVK